MTDGIQTIIFPVKDVAAAKNLYSALLGTQPAYDQPYYVGYNVGGQDIGLDPHGHRTGMTGPTCYLHVDDINARLEALLEAGAEMVGEVRDVGAGKLIATVKDPDGNVVGLLQPA